MVEMYYRRITRVVEYYILFCFIIITVVPLLNYSWVPGFIRVIYFTGFPLLLALILISLVKDAFLEMLKRRFESPTSPSSSHRK